jgi:hypothetical protein
MNNDKKRNNIMNNSLKYIVSVAVITAFVLPLCAGPKTYTLKNGRVLVAPYIVGRKPNGLEVGHADGVSFIPFTQMTKKTQERFNYSPKKSQAFEKSDAAYKKKQAALKKQEHQAYLKRRQEYAERKLAYNFQELGDEIYKTKERIAYLQKEIPKLEADQDKYMNTAVGMSAQSADSAGDNKSGYGNFFGGYSTGSHSSRAERTKRRAVHDVGDEYAEAKSDLKRYNSELEQRILDLRKMERTYAKMGGDVKNIKGSSDTKGKKSFMSNVTDLFK